LFLLGKDGVKMHEKRILDAFSDETFVKALLALDSAEDVQTALKNEKEIEISVEDIKRIRASIIAGINASGEELSLEALDDVAGGNMISTIVPLITPAFRSFVTIMNSKNW
jgi:hypothetical protein